jgi:hypothetical protein
LEEFGIAAHDHRSRFLYIIGNYEQADRPARRAPPVHSGVGEKYIQEENPGRADQNGGMTAIFGAARRLACSFLLRFTGDRLIFLAFGSPLRLEDSPSPMSGTRDIAPRKRSSAATTAASSNGTVNTTLK